MGECTQKDFVNNVRRRNWLAWRMVCVDVMAQSREKGATSDSGGGLLCVDEYRLMK